MLAASSRQFDRQKRIGQLAVQDVTRAAQRGMRAAANMVVRYQAASIEVALQSTPDMLAEQGASTSSVATVNRTALLSAPLDVARLMSTAANQYALDRLTTTLVQDAGRTATSVDYATRPQVVGYIRIVGGACCSRCAVLAGRIYRYSTGFLRHSNCRCTMEPVTDWSGTSAPDPMTLFRTGQITDLSRADTRAINDGADIFQVVNANRKAAGLSVQSSVIRGTRFNFTTEGTTTRGLYGKNAQAAGAVERRGGQLRAKQSRLTPDTIYRVASDREHALRLLKHYGYIT